MSDAGHTLPSPRTKIAQAKPDLIFVLVEMGEFDPDSWDFISPAAHKNTHVLGRLLEFLFAREAHKNRLRSFNSRRKARRCFTPSPQNTKPPEWARVF